MWFGMDIAGNMINVIKKISTFDYCHMANGVIG